MASTKERQRWDAMFNAQARRMERQRDALTRLLALNTEFSAALMEIAEGDDLGPDQSNETVEYLRNRAREAVARVAQPATATARAVEESDRQFEQEMEAAQDG